MVKLAMLLFQRRDQLGGLMVLIQDATKLFSPATQEAPRLGAAEEGSMSWLQESLNKLMDAKLVVDGAYGPLTNAAVNAFQKSRGLVADGWAGPETVALIIQELSPTRT